MQPLSQMDKCLSAMRAPVFFFRIQFGRTHPQFRHQKQWVIAKTTHAFFFQQFHHVVGKTVVYHAFAADCAALCAVAGVEFRAPLQTSDTLNAVIARLRETVPPLEQDRYLAPDLAEAANLVREGELVGAVAPELLAEVRP